jgi:hypothetical protein
MTSLKPSTGTALQADTVRVQARQATGVPKGHATSHAPLDSFPSASGYVAGCMRDAAVERSEPWYDDVMAP